MALDLTEYTERGAELITQSVAVGAFSERFQSRTRAITVTAGEDCRIEIGGEEMDLAATAKHQLLKAGVQRDLPVKPGQKLAVRAV